MAATLLVSSLAAQEVPPGFDQEGYEKATTTLLCDCGCHPQSVHACACGRAAEMRDEMRAMIASGMSGDEVIAHYVKQGGEQVLIVPEAQGFNLVAWLGPLVALLGATGVLFLVLRRWSGRRAASIEPLEAAPAAGDPYHDRLRDALERFE
jgi:cytochrome c-type biogenesis protein CcmH/NrfF